MCAKTLEHSSPMTLTINVLAALLVFPGQKLYIL